MFRTIDDRRRLASWKLSAITALAALASLALPGAALAATAPNLGSTSTYIVVSDTLANTAAGSVLTGDVCFTTGPAVAPTVFGTIVTPCPGGVGTDQAAARADLLGQTCTPLGAAVALNAIDVGGGPGIYPPGCYSSTGAMSITTGTTVTLNGPGVYIFRPGGALNTEANSIVLAANGACASDVFWAPNGASTIGANSSFVGNILEGAGAANDITVSSTASFEGRALAFGHTVTIDTDTMFVPTCGGGGPPIVAIPTLSMGPMVLFAGLLALLGFVAMRRRLAKQN